MTEWLKVAVLKTAVALTVTAGSNPAPPVKVWEVGGMGGEGGGGCAYIMESKGDWGDWSAEFNHLRSRRQGDLDYYPPVNVLSIAGVGVRAILPGAGGEEQLALCEGGSGEPRVLWLGESHSHEVRIPEGVQVRRLESANELYLVLRVSSAEWEERGAYGLVRQLAIDLQRLKKSTKPGAPQLIYSREGGRSWPKQKLQKNKQ